MSNTGSYSLFPNPDCEDLQLDLSWILKLVDQDSCGDQDDLSNSSSPVKREGSSGYSSGVESIASERTLVSDNFSLPDKRDKSEGDNYPWSDSPLSLSDSFAATDTLVDTFYVFATHQVQQANMESEFFLQGVASPDVSSLDLDFPSNFQASVIHSSGFVQPVMMEKMVSLPGYRCTFYPLAPGRYSASVYQDGGVLNKRSNIHGCPLDILISRNYAFDSRSPLVENLPVGENGSKYWGIATDKFSDVLYVTDRDTHEVVALHSTAGRPLFRFGRNSTSSVESLYRPTGIVCDSVNKRLIVCDKDNHRVVFVTMDGHFISAFGKKGYMNGEFNYPWDVDISPTGDLIVVTDSRNHRIQMFDRFGNFIRKFSVFETHPFEYKLEFDYPRGVTFDHEGKNIFVTDFNTHNVLELNLELTESRKLIPPGKMCRPQGITVDDIGNLLVCDSRKNCIRIVTSDGDLLSTVERVGKYPLTVPADATIMRGGEVAVVDIFGRVRVF